MNKAKTYSLQEVFNNVLLGFTFEFYSSKGTDFIVKNLADITLKNIILTNGYSYSPSYANGVLIKEYEGKKPRYAFRLAQQRYDSIIPLMESVLEWISETSDCTNDTMMRVNMSFDNKHLETLYGISNMNPQKLILKIDEEYIYSKFPENEYSSYNRSVKELLPISETAYTQDLIKNVNYIIGIPKKNYYGINFEDYTRGILEFNYIGGPDYSEKKDEISEIIKYYVINTYKSLNESEYTKEELIELKQMTNEYNKIYEAYHDPKQFVKLYPDIKISVDLISEEQTIKSYWQKIRGVLFQTVINNKMNEGRFNYDSDYGVFQLRDANIDCTNIDGFDLIQCEVQGIVESCNLISCEVNNARIYNSKIVKGNSIFDSYLSKVRIDPGNEIDGCFVENNHELLDCNITNSILKFVGLGKSARMDESTVVIDRENKLQQPSVGIEVEEMKDYNYIKNMSKNKSGEHIFGNEYIKKTYI